MVIGEIISVGTEIILGNTLNTNTHYISKKLSSIGINVQYHTAVIDNPNLLEDVINISMKRADLIVFTGGLGPTYDDMTKEIVAKALGIELVLNSYVKEDIENYFKKMNKPMTSNNIKQAYVPEGSHLLKRNWNCSWFIY